MKVKVIAALMMTVVMSLAAFASEQRRMCNETVVADASAVIADEAPDTAVIAMKVNVAN